jgi:hypothetical protein
MLRQRQRPDHCCLRKVRGEGQIHSAVFGHRLGSASQLPGVSHIRIPQPPPCTPPPLQWGGTSQIRRNNGLGRGQVQLQAQQRAGVPARQGMKGQCWQHLCWTQFPLLWGVCRAKPSFSGWISLTSGNFNFILARQLAWSSRERCRGSLGSSDCSSLALQVRDAWRLLRPTFPTWE